jgi:hypothetical protein
MHLAKRLQHRTAALVGPATPSFSGSGGMAVRHCTQAPRGPRPPRPASPDFRAAKRFPECVNRAGLSVEPCTGACQAALPGRGGFCDGCSRVPWRKKRRARGNTIR